MKNMLLIVLLAGLAANSLAFAQSTSSIDTTRTPDRSNAESAAVTAAPPPVTVVGYNGQPVTEATRAQIYQQLMQAQQDGQLAYLNRTLYAHH